MMLSIKSRGTGSDKTRIDTHLQMALLVAMLGCFPVGLYFVGFNAFGTSQLPWQIALAVVTLGSLACCANYSLNRHSRRLFWEGLASTVGALILWLMLGSCWLFYFSFAPMPLWIRAIALFFYVSLTSCWILMWWRNYQRATVGQDLIDELYIEGPDQIVYSGSKSDATVACIDSPWTGLSIPYRAFSIGAPIIIAYAFVSQRIFEKSSGPHGVFIILSILSLPMSNGIFGLLTRTIFFHVYLARKLERKTGKKVLLGP